MCVRTIEIVCTARDLLCRYRCAMTEGSGAKVRLGADPTETIEGHVDGLVGRSARVNVERPIKEDIGRFGGCVDTGGKYIKR